VRHVATLLVATLVGCASGGCTGIELSALAVAALSAGAGSVVKTGTEYTLTGVAYRTFSLSLEDLAGVVRESLERMQFVVEEAEADGYELLIAAGGIDRTVQLRFTPITPGVTRLRVAVTKGRLLFLDRATASELLTQIERTVLHLNSTSELR
jgi:hypothetical protein